MQIIDTIIPKWNFDPTLSVSGYGLFADFAISTVAWSLLQVVLF